MKILLLLFAFITLTVISKAQDIDSTAPVSFTEVVKVDSIKKDELYLRARNWISSSYKDSKAVLNIQDQSNGQLSGKGTFQYVCNSFFAGGSFSGWIEYQITIIVKDGKYKIDINNFIHSGSGVYAVNFGLITNATLPPESNAWVRGTKSQREKIWNDIKKNINSYIPELIGSLKQGMLKPSGVSSKDW